MYTVVITGITGKSGQRLLDRMNGDFQKFSDYKFKLLCRTGEKSKNVKGRESLDKALREKKLNIELVETDLDNAESIKRAFGEKVDMLFHVAGIRFTKNLVPIALECGVDNIVMVHTTGIYSKYKAAGEGYRQIEKEIQELVEGYRQKGREIAITTLRPTMIYGDLNDKNVSKFIKMVDKYRLFPTINGARYELQPVWCNDLGDAYFAVMTNWQVAKNKEYILSGGKPIELRDMFKEIAKQLGVKNKFISCPYPLAYFGAWVVFIFSFTIIDYREKVQRMVEPRAYPHDLAKTELGYNPAEFKEGVKEEIIAYKERKQAKKV